MVSEQPTSDRQQALELLRSWEERAGRRGPDVSLPIGFVRDAVKQDPPLARMIRGGRGEVRLGMYLAMVLRATRAPHDIKHNPLAFRWAEMLALTDPRKAGARRVQGALRWLSDERLIEVTPRPGRAPTVKLLNVAGDRSAYSVGTSRYIGVPSGLWRQGWILDLSARALALLLVLLELQGGRKSVAEAPFVDHERRASYGLSDDTWTRATKELQVSGLLKVNRMPMGDEFRHDRLRNTFWIDRARLAESPWA